MLRNIENNNHLDDILVILLVKMKDWYQNHLQVQNE